MPPFQKTPNCFSPLQMNLISLHRFDCHTKYRLTPRWYLCQPCEKASSERHRSLCQLYGTHLHCCYSSGGKWTCISQLETMPDSPVRLQSNPKMHVSTGEEISGFSLGSRRGIRTRYRLERNPERPLTTGMEIDFPEDTRVAP